MPEALGKIQNPHKIHLVSCFVMDSICVNKAHPCLQIFLKDVTIITDVVV